MTRTKQPKTERATVDDAHDGRSNPRSVAAAMSALQDTYVTCARCGQRSASHVANDTALVCADCYRHKPLTIAEARRRLENLEWQGLDSLR